MKKLLLFTMLLICGMVTAQAQKPAEIKFEETTHHFGEFSQKNPKQTCTFTFTNVGEQPLVINQAVREAILQGLDRERLQHLAEDEGMKTLWQDGVDKALKGETSLSELKRVI